MSALVELLLTMSFVFAGSYLLARTLVRGRPDSLPLAAGDKLRLVSAAGSYRSRLVRSDRYGLWIEAPLHRDAYVPVRQEESLLVQAPRENGLLTFRSKVLHRDAASHELVLAPPEHWRFSERRSEPRTRPARLSVLIDGHRSQVEDLSRCGTRVASHSTASPGTRVTVEFQPGVAVVAYVLEARSTALHGRLATQLRLWFEEPLSRLP